MAMHRQRIAEKRLADGGVLKKFKVATDDVDEDPNNNLRLMFYVNEKNPVGSKFAPEVCHLLSPEVVDQYFNKIESGVDFTRRAREIIEQISGN